MPLTKSKGNMYRWVTHTHSHLAGFCPHACRYCYVQAMAKRFTEMHKRYSGPIWLPPVELAVRYGSGRTIFIEHMNDLFAAAVPYAFIAIILEHCRTYSENTYVFQTKNPARYHEFLQLIPKGSLLGTTIESNRHYSDISYAPPPADRFSAMTAIKGFQKFVTIEPILDFDVEVLVRWLVAIMPMFVNIGADSKKSYLSEPSAAKIAELIAALNMAGIEIREKNNLQRLLIL